MFFKKNRSIWIQGRMSYGQLRAHFQQKIIAVLYLSEIWVMKDDHQRNPNNSESDHGDLDLFKGKMYNYYKGNLCNRKEIMLLGDLLLTFGITTTSPHSHKTQEGKETMKFRGS